MPKFSIIVPVYNAESVIRQCVESILAQDYKDYELLLIDDCSQDSSLDLCMGYASSNANVFVYHQEKNKGVSAARNVGIEKSSGEYILFIDSDDFISQDYLMEINKYTLNDIYDLVAFGNYNYLVSENGDGNVRASVLNYTLDGNMPSSIEWESLFVKTFFASPCNKLYKMNIIKEQGIYFNETCVCYEDYLFNISYCKFVKNFISIATPLYYYRQKVNENHVLKRKWGQQFQISRKVAIETERFIRHKEENFRSHDLWRYPFQAYLVELQYIYHADREKYESAAKQLLLDDFFKKAVSEIKPSGKWLFCLKMAIRMHNYRLGIELLRLKM